MDMGWVGQVGMVYGVRRVRWVGKCKASIFECEFSAVGVFALTSTSSWATACGMIRVDTALSGQSCSARSRLGSQGEGDKVVIH